MLPAHIRAQSTQLRIAINNRNRNMVDSINRKYNLDKLTRALVLFGHLTKKERQTAMKLRTRINNPSCKVTV